MKNTNKGRVLMYKKKVSGATAFIAVIALTGGCVAPVESDEAETQEVPAYSFEFTGDNDNDVDNPAGIVSAVDFTEDDDVEAGSTVTHRASITSGSFSPEMLEDNLNADRDDLDTLQEEWEVEQERIAEEERLAEEQRLAEEAERQRIAEEQAAEAERQRQAEAERQQQAQQQQSQQGGSSNSSGGSSSGGNSGGSSGSSSGGSSGGSSSGGGSSAPAPAPAPPSGRASAESVAASVCGATVTWENLGPGILGLYSWGASGFRITTREGVATSRLNFVAAHECGHIMQYRAFNGDQGAAKARLNAIYNTSGTMGLEQNADCIALALGYSDTPGGYGTSCGGGKASAATAIINGQKP